MSRNEGEAGSSRTRPRGARVMAMDPGKWTGVSWATLRAGRWSRAEVAYSWNMGTGGTVEITGPTENHRVWRCMEQVMLFEPDVLVVEQYVEVPGLKRNSDGSGTEPMRFNARLDFLLWMLSDECPLSERDTEFLIDEIGHLPELVWQTAPVRLDITVDMIKEAGLYTGNSGQGRGKDSLAATQHLLHYVQQQNKLMRKVNDGR